MPQQRGRGEGSIRQRRRADGSVFWEARARINGPQVSFCDDTKTGAMAKARAARSDAERGLRKAPSTLTVQQYLDRWLAEKKRAVRYRSYLSHDMHIRLHIGPALGGLRLVDLTPRDVRKLLADVRDKGVSESTVDHVRTTLSMALRAAVTDGIAPKNVAEQVPVPKSTKPAFVPEVVTPDEARLIIAAFKGYRHEPDVMFAIATGMRQGEQLALRWSDVNLQARTATVEVAVDITEDGQRVSARPKSEKSQRVMPLPELAIRALEMRARQREEDRILAGEAWEGGDLVFGNRTGGMRSGKVLTAKFQDRLRRAGLPVIRWHALRRIFAATLQEGGASLGILRDLMGHKSVKTTEGYAYTLPESRARLVAAIDNLIDAGNGRAANEG